MLAWILWFIYAIIPALITHFANLKMQNMTILYFIFALAAAIAWGIYEKKQKKHPEKL